MLRDSPSVKNSYWMITLIVSSNNERDSLREYLGMRGIETRPTFFPVHTMPMYASQKVSLPVAEDIALRGMNVPSYPDLSDSDVAKICGVIRDFYAK